MNTTAAPVGGPFGIASVMRGVVFTYRHAFARVMVSAAIVFGGTAVIDVVIARLMEHESWDPLTITLVALGTLTSVLGMTFYPGFLDSIVGEIELGHEPQSLGQALRSAPYAKLIAADLLVVAVTVVGLLLLVIPGLVAYTLLALTGPLLTIEGVGPIRAMRRSAQLVRRHFWLTFLLVVVPLELEHTIVHWVRHTAERWDLASVFVVHAVTGMIVGSFVGIAVVTVAMQLRREESEATPSFPQPDTHVERGNLPPESDQTTPGRSRRQSRQ